MPDYLDQPRYFDQIQVGDCWRSAARTITETDVVQFACLTGDFNPLHVDHNYARSTPFGRPVAHGLLGLSLAAGLASHAPAVVTVAFLRVTEWRFMHPIYLGDTVRVETEIVDKQPRSRRHGLVVWRRQLLNDENNVIVQQGMFETLVKTQQAQAAA
jgi:acyl dehydratase